MRNLDRLKELVFLSDDKSCFIERERILTRLEKEMADYTNDDKYAIILSKLLAEVSTPIESCDYFAGRIVEALPDDGMTAPHPLLYSNGHASLDYERLLKIGLSGILSDIKDVASKKGDEESLSFAKNAEIVAHAVRDYALRYSKAAEEKGFSEMARALSVVPFEPAYDYYSALQSVWLIHMIASGYIGSRDYAFGNFDKYMLPYYEQAIKDGKTREELTELLAGFMMKTNEICGRHSHNYESKPVHCQSSKQYINIGGEKPNELSLVVLDAAMRINMAQPTVTVLLDPEANEEFTDKTFEALALLTDKMNVYNYPQTVKCLIEKGIPEDIAKDYTYSACCTFDLNYHTIRREYFVPVPQVFLEVLHSKSFGSIEEILVDFETELTKNIQSYADRGQKAWGFEYAKKMFVLDSLLFTDTAKECRYACDSTPPYNVLNLFCPGIATVGDSLLSLDKLVFEEKRFSYDKFMEILDKNYESYEDLRQEILDFTRFGNDTENDEYTVRAANTFISAVEKVELWDNFYAIPGFYSLERDNVWKEEVGATPDGRLSGTPFSENQSPTYGADKKGITSLLNSVSKLPFNKAVTGGFNIAFAQKTPAEILKALVLGYFDNGGYHVGVTVMDREMLLDAMEHPEKYQSLTVRLYGFSEYFVNLPKWQQLAVINRTEYLV